MKHFLQAGQLDVAPLAAAVTWHADHFGRISWREKHPGSPHPDTETIYLRMPPEISVKSVFHGLDVIDLPLMQVAAFADAVRQVAAVAGALPARAMIVKLKPGGRIAPHIDQGAYAEATHRWHAAIETNGQAWLQIADERLHMAPGELWWFDKHALHYGANEGQTDRVHLIVDTFR